MSKTVRIGFTGYSTQKFDEKLAYEYITLVLETDLAPFTEAVVVSGLTDLGIPAIVYRVATSLGMKTVGIACEKANEYNCYPVDEKIIVGAEWGDESQTFLDNIDMLVRIGGGTQAIAETAKFREMYGESRVIEIDLVSGVAQ